MEITGSESKQPLAPKSGKVPVVRGARACSVCRVAKMKCVGAEDGATPCQRCRRTGQECIFEKHKRGRKPGSKLSEASKMLRRLERGLHNAKARSQTGNAQSVLDPRGGTSIKSPEHADPTLNGQLPPEKEEVRHEGDPQQGLYPSNIVQTHRNSFFKTILNPQHQNPTAQLRSLRSPPSSGNTDTTVDDVITLNILSEADANRFFDLVFLRLNPFINLFDPMLHTATYVRSKSRFLFTTLMMAICKFFEPKKYKQCQDLANDMATKAFTYGWKSVEVVQAFACLTYYKDADDNACRMAVELGLNRHYARPPERETAIQRLERRNRERTYLVLFIHDRSLSTQTGRSWMLPECELVRNSMTWHEHGGSDALRPEDVIVASFAQLRRIAAEATDVCAQPQPGTRHDILDERLADWNSKLSHWSIHWEREMSRANADRFHVSFINLFRLYIRLFLNSFGLQAAMSSTSENRVNPRMQTLTACYQSALDLLKLIFNDFSSMAVLCYSQDSITIMSAYAAIFLLRLLRSPISLYDGATEEFYQHITKTADAYAEASSISPAVTYLHYHARFLRSLVANDQERRNRENSLSSVPSRYEDPAHHPNAATYEPPAPANSYANSSQLTYSPPQHLYNYPPMVNGHMSPSIAAVPPHAPKAEQEYWRSMFGNLGFPDTDPGHPLVHGTPGFMSYSPSHRYQPSPGYGPPPY